MRGDAVLVHEVVDQRGIQVDDIAGFLADTVEELADLDDRADGHSAAGMP